MAADGRNPTAATLALVSLREHDVSRRLLRSLLAEVVAAHEFEP